MAENKYRYASPTRDPVNWRTSMESIVAATDYNLRKAFGSNRKEFESSIVNTRMSIEEIERGLRRPEVDVPDLGNVPRLSANVDISDRLLALEMAVRQLDSTKSLDTSTQSISHPVPSSTHTATPGSAVQVPPPLYVDQRVGAINTRTSTIDKKVKSLSAEMERIRKNVNQAKAQSAKASNTEGLTKASVMTAALAAMSFASTNSLGTRLNSLEVDVDQMSDNMTRRSAESPSTRGGQLLSVVEGRLTSEFDALAKRIHEVEEKAEDAHAQLANKVESMESPVREAQRAASAPDPDTLQRLKEGERAVEVIQGRLASLEESVAPGADVALRDLKAHTAALSDRVGELEPLKYKGTQEHAIGALAARVEHLELESAKSANKSTVASILDRLGKLEDGGGAGGRRGADSAALEAVIERLERLEAQRQQGPDMSAVLERLARLEEGGGPPGAAAARRLSGNTSADWDSPTASPVSERVAKLERRQSFDQVKKSPRPMGDVEHELAAVVARCAELEAMVSRQTEEIIHASTKADQVAHSVKDVAGRADAASVAANTAKQAADSAQAASSSALNTAERAERVALEGAGTGAGAPSSPAVRSPPPAPRPHPDVSALADKVAELEASFTSLKAEAEDKVKWTSVMWDEEGGDAPATQQRRGAQRSLDLSGESDRPPARFYTVSIKTGPSHGAGTDGQVRVEVLGEDGRWWQVPDIGQSAEHPREPFERGHTDTFRVECARDLGDVQSIKLSHDGRGLASDWEVVGAEVAEEGSGKVWRFDPSAPRWVKNTKPLTMHVTSTESPPASTAGGAPGSAGSSGRPRKMAGDLGILQAQVEALRAEVVAARSSVDTSMVAADRSVDSSMFTPATAAEGEGDVLGEGAGVEQVKADLAKKGDLLRKLQEQLQRLAMDGEGWRESEKRARLQSDDGLRVQLAQEQMKSESLDRRVGQLEGEVLDQIQTVREEMDTVKMRSRESHIAVDERVSACEDAAEASTRAAASARSFADTRAKEMEIQVASAVSAITREAKARGLTQALDAEISALQEEMAAARREFESSMAEITTEMSETGRETRGEVRALGESALAAMVELLQQTNELAAAERTTRSSAMDAEGRAREMERDLAAAEERAAALGASLQALDGGEGGAPGGAPSAQQVKQLRYVTRLLNDKSKECVVLHKQLESAGLQADPSTSAAAAAAGAEGDSDDPEVPLPEFHDLSGVSSGRGAAGAAGPSPGEAEYEELLNEVADLEDVVRSDRDAMADSMEWLGEQIAQLRADKEQELGALSAEARALAEAAGMVTREAEAHRARAAVVERAARAVGELEGSGVASGLEELASEEEARERAAKELVEAEARAVRAEEARIAREKEAREATEREAIDAAARAADEEAAEARRAAEQALQEEQEAAFRAKMAAGGGLSRGPTPAATPERPERGLHPPRPSSPALVLLPGETELQAKLRRRLEKEREAEETHAEEAQHAEEARARELDLSARSHDDATSAALDAVAEAQRAIAELSAPAREAASSAPEENPVSKAAAHAGAAGFLRGLDRADSRREQEALDALNYVPPGPPTTYEIAVRTGSSLGAGTDSNVCLDLCGDTGEWWRPQLGRSREHPESPFDRKNNDTFTVDCRGNLGDLQRVRLGNDGTGYAADWEVERVLVTEQRTGMSWLFRSGNGWVYKDQPLEIGVSSTPRGTPRSSYIPQGGGSLTPEQSFSSIATTPRESTVYDESGDLSEIGQRSGEEDLFGRIEEESWQRAEEAAAFIEKARTAAEEEAAAARARIEEDRLRAMEAAQAARDAAEEEQRKAEEAAKARELADEQRATAEAEAEEAQNQAAAARLKAMQEAEAARAAAAEEKRRLEDEAEADRLAAAEERSRRIREAEEEQRRMEEEAAAERAKMAAEQAEAHRVAEEERRRLEEEQRLAAEDADKERKRLEGEQEEARRKAEEERHRLQEEQRAAEEEAENERKRLEAEKEEARREAEEERSRLEAEAAAEKERIEREKAEAVLAAERELQAERERMQRVAEEEAEAAERERALSRPRVPTPYSVAVRTGHAFGAGTDADVKVELQGEGGLWWSPEDLGKSQDHRNPFERNQRDTFRVTADRDLGPLRRVRLSHDGSGFGSDWQVEEVEVVHTETGESWYFKVDGDGWISKSKPLEMSLTSTAKGAPPAAAAAAVQAPQPSPGAASSHFGSTDTPRSMVDPSPRELAVMQAMDQVMGGSEGGVVAPPRDSPAPSHGSQIGETQTPRSVSTAVDPSPRELAVMQAMEEVMGGPPKDPYGTSASIVGPPRGSPEVSSAPPPPASSAVKGASDEGDEFDEFDEVFEEAGLEAPARDSPIESARSSSGGGSEKSAGPSFPYMIEVITGTTFGAGTNANVTLEVKAKDGQWVGMKLNRSLTHKDPFERGNTDKFQVACHRELGAAPQLVRLSHDGRGFGADWQVDEVVVEDPATGARSAFQPKDRQGWIRGDEVLELVPKSDVPVMDVLGGDPLSGPAETSAEHDPTLLAPEAAEPMEEAPRSVGEGAAEEAEAAAVPPPPPSCVYDIAVTTGSSFGAGTDADVKVEVQGEGGRWWGPEKLGKSREHKDPFERGHTDTFTVDGPPEAMGELSNVRLSHDGSGFGSDWQVKIVEVADAESGRTWLFRAAGSLWVKAAQAVEIPLTAATGGEEGGSEGQSEMEVPESMEESGEISEDFDYSSSREIEVPTVAEAEAEAEAAAQPAAVPSMPLTGAVAQPVAYRISVETGSSFGAGTDANVRCVLKARNDREVVPLVAGPSAEHKNPFERGHTDTYTFSAAPVGELEAVELSHDGKGMGADWQVKKVEVVEEATGEAWEFEAFGPGEWLKKKGEVVVLPLTGYSPPSDPPADDTPASQGVAAEAASAADSFDDDAAFEAAPAVAPVTRAAPGAADEVMDLEESGEISEDFEFTTGGEMDTERSDAVKEAQSVPLVSSEQEGEGCEYEIRVVTGSAFGAGTDANVAMQMQAEDGEWHNPGPLMTSQDHKDPFERGKTDSFTRWCPRELGEVKAVSLSHDGTGVGSAWQVAEVVVARVSESGAEEARYTFRPPSRGGGWVNKGEAMILEPLRVGKQGQGSERSTPTSSPSPSPREMPAATSPREDSPWVSETSSSSHVPSVSPGQPQQGPAGTPVAYRISVETGSSFGAGTDANVRCVLKARNDREVVPLVAGPSAEHKNPFERGHTDTYTFSAAPVGELEAVELSHDGKGMGADWQVKKVEVVEEATGEAWVFEAFGPGEWLKKKGEVIVLPVTAHTPASQGAAAEAAPAADSFDDDADFADFPEEPAPEAPQEAASEEDEVEAMARSLGVDEVAPEEEEEQGPAFPYMIEVATGKDFGAGTDANVTLECKTEDGHWVGMKLNRSVSHGDPFERGNTDKFQVACPRELGAAPQLVRLSHDGSGLGAAWQVDEVVVEDPATGARSAFQPKDRQGWIRGDEVLELVPKSGSSLSQATSASEGVSHRLPAEAIVDDDETFDYDFSGSEKNPTPRPSDPPHPTPGGPDDDDSFDFDFSGSEAALSARGPAPSIPEVEAARSPQGPVVAVYDVSVSTGSSFGAGTDAGVVLEFLEAGGATWRPTISGRSREHANPFERGHTDTFTLPTQRELADPFAVRVSQDGTGRAAEWEVAEVKVTEPATDRSWLFQAARGKGRWLRRPGDVVELPLVPKAEPEPDAIDPLDGPADPLAAQPVDPLDGPADPLAAQPVDPLAAAPDAAEPMEDEVEAMARSLGVDEAFQEKEGGASGTPVAYRISVETGSSFGAGTDANVRCVLKARNDREVVPLVAGPSAEHKNPFERGHTDTYTFSAAPVGELEAVELSHDGKGMGADWQVKKVEVVEEATGEAWAFEAFGPGDWLKKKGEVIVLPVTAHTPASQGAAAEAAPAADSFDDDADFADFPEEPAPEAPQEAASEEDEVETMARSLGVDEAAPEEEEEQGPAFPYMIEVATGKDFGPGTDANVTLECKTEDGHWVGMKLNRSVSHGDPFERGNTDKFQVACPRELGAAPQLVRLSHDGSGLGAAWQVDEVVVEDPATGARSAFQPKDRQGWIRGDEVLELVPKSDVPVMDVLGGDPLSGPAETSAEHDPTLLAPEAAEPMEEAPRSVGEGAAEEAEAAAVPPPPPSCVYDIAVTTGSSFGAGTDADVKVEVQGEGGRWWGPEKLGKSREHKDPFERGHTDTFTVDGPPEAMGELSNVRLSHDGSGFGSDWQVKIVEVADAESGRTWLFRAAGSLWVKAAQAVEIPLTAATGGEEGGSEGQSEMEVPESMEESGEISEDFDYSSSREIEVPTVAEAEAAAQPAAVPSMPLTGAVAQPVAYRISVETGSSFGAGTDANVRCVLKARNDREVVPLVAGPSAEHKNPFERGHTDTYTFSAAPVGELEAVELSHDGKGMGADWQVKKVEVVEEATGEAWAFEAFGPGEWLKKKGEVIVLPVTAHTPASQGDAAAEAAPAVDSFDDDADFADFPKEPAPEAPQEAASEEDEVEAMARSLGVDEADPEDAMMEEFGREMADPPPPRREGEGCEYEIRVVTGSAFGAGTDANVAMQMQAEDGEWHNPGPLMTSQDHKDPFERGKTDSFTRWCPRELGEVKAVSLSHDGTGVGSAWQVAEVVVARVSESGAEEARYTFRPPSRGGGWVNKGEAMILEPLRVGKQGQGSERSTPASSPSPSPREMPAATSPREDSPWDSESSPREPEMAALVAQSPVPRVPLTSIGAATNNPVAYRISVVTGSSFGAGTDANVRCVLKARNDREVVPVVAGPSAEHKNPFERGHTDTYTFSAAPVGELEAVELSHDGKGMGADWQVKKVEVVEEATGEAWEFEASGAGEWLKKKGEVIVMPLTGRTSQTPRIDEDAAATAASPELESEPSMTPAPGGMDSFDDDAAFEAPPAVAPVTRAAPGAADEVMDLEESGEISEDFEFTTSGEIETETPHVGQEHAATFEQETQRQGCEYELRVTTGSAFGAGTDANVTLSIQSEDGEWHNPGPLMTSQDHKDPFERGKTDSFTRWCPRELGEVKAVSLSHDGTGVGSAWQVAEVVVARVSESGAEEARYTFRPPSRGGGWVNKGEAMTLVPLGMPSPAPSPRRPEPGSTSQSPVVPSVPLTGLATASVPYRISVVTGSSFGAGTDANVRCVLKARNDREVVPVVAGPSAEHKNPFERGHTDTYTFSAAPVGELEAVELSHDGKGMGADWQVKKVEVVEEATGEAWEFEASGAGEWLKKKGELLVLPVTGRTSQTPRSSKEDMAAPPPPEQASRALPTPTDDSDADSDVWSPPKRGSTPAAAAPPPADDPYNFDSEITGAVAGGALPEPEEGAEASSAPPSEPSASEGDSSMMYGGAKPSTMHDAAAGFLHGLDRAEQRAAAAEGGGDDPYNFDSEVTGAAPGGPAATPEKGAEAESRLATPMEEEEAEAPEEGTYSVCIRTGQDMGAGTDAGVTVELLGEDGSWRAVGLGESNEHPRDPFERANVDTFSPAVAGEGGRSLGEIQCLRLSVDGRGLASDWEVEQVEIVELATERAWLFKPRARTWVKAGAPVEVLATPTRGSPATRGRRAPGAAGMAAPGVRPAAGSDDGSDDAMSPSQAIPYIGGGAPAGSAAARNLAGGFDDDEFDDDGFMSSGDIPAFGGGIPYVGGGGGGGGGGGQPGGGARGGAAPSMAKVAKIGAYDDSFESSTEFEGGGIPYVTAPPPTVPPPAAAAAPPGGDEFDHGSSGAFDSGDIPTLGTEGASSSAAAAAEGAVDPVYGGAKVSTMHDAAAGFLRGLDAAEERAEAEAASGGGAAVVQPPPPPPPVSEPSGVSEDFDFDSRDFDSGDIPILGTEGEDDATSSQQQQGAVDPVYGGAKVSTMHDAAAGFLRGLDAAEERAEAAAAAAPPPRPASPQAPRRPSSPSVPDSPGVMSVGSMASSSLGREEELVAEIEGVEIDLGEARAAGDDFQEEILTMNLEELRQELASIRGS